MGVCRRTPKLEALERRPLGWDVPHPGNVRTETSLPTCVTVPNLVVLGEIVWISAFQGHSR